MAYCTAKSLFCGADCLARLLRYSNEITVRKITATKLTGTKKPPNCHVTGDLL